MADGGYRPCLLCCCGIRIFSPPVDFLQILSPPDLGSMKKVIFFLCFFTLDSE